MPRFWGAGRRVSAGSSSSPPPQDSIAGPSSAHPLEQTTSANSENPPDVPMTTRWYILFDGPFPGFLVPMCEALNLSWSVVKNSTEGSSGSTDAARNKFRERFVILFPQNMDDLPDLMEDEPPPMYTDKSAENARKVLTKRNIFDSVSLIPFSNSSLIEGEDMEPLCVRNGLGELFSALYMTRSLRSVVQVRAARQDKSMEDNGKIRGVAVDLRSLQFNGVQDIEATLDDLTKKGVIWAKYGLWCSKSLSAEDNFKRGQWIIFGTWPETLKLSTKKDGVMNNWKEPYHAGRGVGRYSTPMGGGAFGTT